METWWRCILFLYCACQIHPTASSKMNDWPPQLPTHRFSKCFFHYPVWTECLLANMETTYSIPHHEVAPVLRQILRPVTASTDNESVQQSTVWPKMWPKNTNWHRTKHEGSAMSTIFFWQNFTNCHLLWRWPLRILPALATLQYCRAQTEKDQQSTTKHRRVVYRLSFDVCQFTLGPQQEQDRPFSMNWGIPHHFERLGRPFGSPTWNL